MNDFISLFHLGLQDAKVLVPYVVHDKVVRDSILEVNLPLQVLGYDDKSLSY